LSSDEQGNINNDVFASYVGPSKYASYLEGRLTDKKTETVQLPILLQDDANLYEFLEFFNLDEEIRDLSQNMVERKAVNREWLFRNDELCVRIGTVIASTIAGNGLIIESQNEDVKGLLAYFLDNLNGHELRHRRYNFFDFIRDAVFANIMHGESIFVKEILDTNQRLGVFPIDVKTTVPVIHDRKGWKKYIQYAFESGTLPGVSGKEMVDSPEDIEIAKKRFYSDAYEPATRAFMNDRRVVDKIRPVKHHLKDEFLYVVNLYKYPLVDALLETILNKKYMLFYMRKATEKYAGPLLSVKVGTETAHPTDKESYLSLLDKASIQAAAARFGDAIAIPYNWEIKALDVSARTFNFIDMVEWTNKTIIQGLGASMDFFQSFGNSLGLTSIIHDVWIRDINNQRNKLKAVSYDMCYDYLKSCDYEFRKEYPEGISKEVFDVAWAPLKEDDRDRLVAAVVQLATSHILKDTNEARKLIREAGIFDLEVLDDETSDELTAQHDPEHSNRKYKYDERPRIRPQMTRFQKETLRREALNKDYGFMSKYMNEINEKE
jgi:hypothetical protein